MNNQWFSKVELLEHGEKHKRDHQPNSDLREPLIVHRGSFSQLVTRFKAQFRLVKPIKPKASRDKSAETYLVGIGLKPA